VMVGIVVYAGVFAGASEVDKIRSDSFAALGYVANWRFIFSGQSYFDQFTQPSPLRHMWSLAIEEQFYLLWPLIVFFVLWWRRSLRALMVTCIALMAGSAVLMAVLYQPGHDPSRVYYGTDTRAQSLLVGAVVGILLFQHGPIRTRLARGALRVAAVAGAAYTLWLFWRMSERTDNLYRGGFLLAALAVSAVIVSVVQPQRGALGAALSWAPLRWIGRVSYGLYLWHWPIYLTLTETRTGVHGYPLLFVRLAVTTVFAAVSYYAVELPIRRGTLRLPHLRVLVPVGVAALVAALVMTTTGGGASTASQTLRALERGAAPPPQAKPAVQARSTFPVQLPEPPPNVPTGSGPVPFSTPPAPTKVLIVGDSVAGTLGLGFDVVGPESNLQVWNRGTLGCGLLRGGEVVMGGQITPENSGCDDWHTRWVENVDAFHPDVVLLLTGAWDVLDRRINGQWYRLGSVEYDNYFLTELDQATRLLSSEGAKVVVLTTPFFSRPELVGQTGHSWPEYDPWRIDRINGLYRDFVDAHPGQYTIIDLNKYVSPQGKFTDTMNGIKIRGDGVHFTHDGSVMVDRWLAPQLSEIAQGKDPDPTNNVAQYDPRHLWKE
jgi:peptidoglycan/LPS O-acetylase OafA/YrhL